MATLTTQSQFDYTGNYDSYWTVQNATSTSVSMQGTNGVTITFYGSFSYPSSDSVTGLVSSLYFYMNGVHMWSAANLNGDPQRYYNYFVQTTQTGFSDALSGSDSISGSSGNDTLKGYGGNDTIDGGSGVDIAAFGLSKSSYYVTATASGYRVAALSGSEGTDTLSNIEYLRFADQTVTVDSMVAHGGTSGNDTLTGGAGAPIDGGAGTDTVVYSSNKANYGITCNSDGTWSVGSDTLTNVERLQFAAAKIALDITGNSSACFDTAGLANAGQVYRLYQAAFNRAPDQVGLAYWIGQADTSVTLTSIASGFTGSIEFMGTYGSLTDHQFVDQIYQNVLHRPGEAAGMAYWYGQLDTLAMSREQVLVGFSDSNENQAAVIGVIQDGIDYTT